MASRGLTESQLAEHTCPMETEVLELDAKTAFEALTDQEKRYAHHLSRACWTGSLIVLFQTSQESPLIFVLLRKLFSSQSIADLKKLAQESTVGFTEDDWKALLVYAAGFFSNKGNYSGFGDSKFVPAIVRDKLEALVFSSEAYKNDPKIVEFLWSSVKEKMFSLEDGELTLGFYPKGVTTYFTKGCTAEDAELVKQFMESQKIGAYNSRVFKRDDFYEIRFASVRSNDDPEERDFLEAAGSDKFKLTRGDYSTLLKIVNQHLEEAEKCSSNELEQQMIGDFIRHFRSGSLEAHKDGSTKWIKDKGPVIETYIGFVIPYRDPAGMRGEFEGLVAIVNKEMSKALNNLVNQATRFLHLLPWPSEYEKDKFLQPDYTAIELLTYAISDVPLGLNYPMYEDIKQNVGFKNLTLSNAIAAQLGKELKPNFLSPENAEIFVKYVVLSFEVQVGLHELLGHGSGKLFKVDENGTFNFDKENTRNPLTGEAISQWYGPGESYDSKFSSLAGPLEECRSEAVGLLLGLVLDVLKVFGHEDEEEMKKVIYVNWLSMVQKGIEALKMYQPGTRSWGQPHGQARYVITRVLLEQAAQLVKIEQKINEVDKKPDLLITFTNDFDLINSVGRAAISDLLLKLQVFKSTGDVESAQSLFDRYSAVADDLDYPYLKFRNVVLTRKEPRKLFVEAATRLGVDNQVQLVSFAASHEGLVQSYFEHFDIDGVDQLVIDLWKKDAESFVA